MNLVRTDMTKAREILNQAKQKNPSSSIFREATMNALGYELNFRGLHDEAVDVFLLNAEAYPESANAFDSLSEACEAAGRKVDAVQYAKRALALLEKDAAMDQQRREAIRKASEDRLKRLN